MTRRGTSAPVTKRYATAAAALPQDIEIWQYQRFVEAPLFAPYEQGMAEFSRWTKSFDARLERSDS